MPSRPATSARRCSTPCARRSTPARCRRSGCSSCRASSWRCGRLQRRCRRDPERQPGPPRLACVDGQLRRGQAAHLRGRHGGNLFDPRRSGDPRRGARAPRRLRAAAALPAARRAARSAPASRWPQAAGELRRRARRGPGLAGEALADDEAGAPASPRAGAVHHQAADAGGCAADPRRAQPAQRARRAGAVHFARRADGADAARVARLRGRAAPLPAAGQHRLGRVLRRQQGHQRRCDGRRAARPRTTLPADRGWRRQGPGFLAARPARCASMPPPSC